MTDLDQEFARARASAVHHLGEDLGERIAALGRVGFRLDLLEDGEETGRDEHGAPQGGSRLGGAALLAPGMPWPTFRDIPMTLLAVLDLAEFVPPLKDGLPDGAADLVLNFFHSAPNVHLYDGGVNFWADPGTWRVVAAAKSEATVTAAPEPAVRFRPAPVRAVPFATYPEAEEPMVDALISGPSGDRFDFDVWNDLSARYRTWSQELPSYTRSGRHQAFGWPWILHHSPTDEGLRNLAERDPAAAATAPPPEDWRLLLQLNSDGRVLTEEGKAWWQWADFGELHFVIPAADLRAGDFSRVEAAVQG
ncbi:YwqG family protein [Thermomonospora amylolytica]|uniref:YwqG family protein n=1 Tax=Thermomonospora amylolytica TaxID=1411117 RepID=UPI000E6CED20|nr:DUF1963 domain-containing protein [Thermomonospora amylolytica]